MNNIDNLQYEKKYLKEKCKYIAGIDEAGRGPLAGPVTCACVVMPLDKKSIIEGINDSKKLTAKKREELFEKITKTALTYSIVFVDENEIDEINILNATKNGMLKCLDNLSVTPDVVLIDAVKLNTSLKTESIIKGDALSYSIAAASILAKVARDRYMCEQDKIYPNYNFKQHKGYGTKEHIQKLKEFGATKIHRKTFIKNFIDIANN